LKLFNEQKLYQSALKELEVVLAQREVLAKSTNARLTNASRLGEIEMLMMR
jgi:hypothetical protein